MPRDISKAQLWAARLDRFRRFRSIYLSILPKRRDHHPVLQLLAEENEVRLVQICSPKSLRRISQNPTTALCDSLSKLVASRSNANPTHSRLSISVLVWATRQQDSGFQQLFVRD